jgi:hypothetical protein
MKGVMPVIQNGGNGAHRPAVAPGYEIVSLGMLEEGILVSIQKMETLKKERRRPVGIIGVDRPGDLNELA